MKRHKYWPRTTNRNEWVCWQMDNSQYLMASPVFNSYRSGGLIIWRIFNKDPTWLFPRGIPKMLQEDRQFWSYWGYAIKREGSIKFSNNFDWIEFLTNPEAMVMVEINA